MKYRQLFYVAYFTVSEKHIYGVMTSEKANKAAVFIYFLSELIECQNKFFKEDIWKTYFIMDNVSIHKTADVKAFLERKWINLLTIPSYSPALNGAETVIQAIKSKTNKEEATEGE